MKVPGDAAQDPRVGVLGDLGDREGGGAARDRAVGEVAVAELREGVVADVQHAHRSARCSEATVKSQASVRSRLATPARRSVRKSLR